MAKQLSNYEIPSTHLRGCFEGGRLTWLEGSDDEGGIAAVRHWEFVGQHLLIRDQDGRSAVFPAEMFNSRAFIRQDVEVVHPFLGQRVK